jgi:hypothetical protein
MKIERQSKQPTQGPSREARKAMSAGFRYSKDIPSDVLRASQIALNTSTNYINGGKK